MQNAVGLLADDYMYVKTESMSEPSLSFPMPYRYVRNIAGTFTLIKLLTDTYDQVNPRMKILFKIDNMSNNDQAIEHFRKRMSLVLKQNPINERDFLYLCKEATDLAKLQWDDRDMITNRITHIWHKHYGELSDEAKYIGGLFADLDVPDAHIDIRERSVLKQWQDLDIIVMYAIHEKDKNIPL